MLCLPVNEGGQGLIHLTSKVKAMRLQTAQKLLYFSDSTPWISFGLAILQRKSKMGLDKQMFLISENDTKEETTIKFYGSVFEAWRYFKLERREHFGFDEPLFYNPWLCQNCTMSNTDISNFVTAGVTKVGNLLDLSKREWVSVQVFTKKIGSRSERIVGNILKNLKTSFPKPLKEFITNSMSGNFIKVSFPEVYVTPKIDQFENDNSNNVNMLLSFKGLQSLPFSMASKENLYNVCVKSFFVGQLRERRDTNGELFSLHLKMDHLLGVLCIKILFQKGLVTCSGEFCIVRWQQKFFCLNVNFQLLHCVLCVKNLTLFFIFFVNVVNYLLFSIF